MVRKKSSELSRIKLSVALATFNEEKNLEQCLKGVKGIADEIAVVDGSSSDETVKIAQSLGARVIITTNKPIFHINKQQAIDECRGEWILQLDADEIITPELAEEIRGIVDHPDQAQLPNAFLIKRKKMFLGQWIEKGGQYPDPVIRFFKKGKARLPCENVHEQMATEGKVGWLKNPLIHLSTPSFAVYLTKDNRYSSLTAQELKEKKVSLSGWSCLNYGLWQPVKTFFSLFIRHRGFQDGFPGFVFAFYSGLHHFTAYAKYWEMEKDGQVDLSKDWV
ncbi:MAG TPA: glycosyltransferase family 2 protein [Clostridia bacterium]|nr:glycosyltransferase family 2 protein [Clostridia bacterium]